MNLDDHIYISEFEWNFDDVPDNDIIACCLWEYARESRSIGLAAEMHWCSGRDILNKDIYEKDPAIKAKDDAEATRIKRRARGQKFNYTQFLKKFWGSEVSVLNFYHTIRKSAYDGCLPWRRLPSAARKSLSQEVSQSFWVHPFSNASVGELEQLWASNRKNLDEIRAKSLPADDDTEFGALIEESSAISLPAEDNDPPEGKLTAAFTLDFARFTDREIIRDFTGWVKSNRPRRWKHPSCIIPGLNRRGHKLIEYRVALERLGLMRLLHHFTPKELRVELPKAWKKYSRKQSEFRREIQAACKTFHKFFPFIPKSERPASTPRKGIWLLETMAMLDKIDREMESKGGH